MSETNKPDTVPGLGFKDRSKALETIQILDGRDPDYQKLAIKGLIGRAKRVLTLTKDKEKLQNINEAIRQFEDWLKDYENSNLSRENRPYLSLDIMTLLKPLADRYKLLKDDASAFFKAYQEVKGAYKNLRTVDSQIEGEATWDIVRNKKLKSATKRFSEGCPNLWEDDLPTKAHMEMIVWAYSPDAAKVKKQLDKIEAKLAQSSQASRDNQCDNDNKSRQSESDSGSEESPRKKTKK